MMTITNMTKNLFLAFILCSAFLAQETKTVQEFDNNFDEKSVNPVSVEYNESEKIMAQEAVQQKMVPLNEEETQELVKNFTDEENHLFKSFLEALSKSLENLKDNPVFPQVEAMFSRKGIALNIVLSVIPCKPSLNEIDANTLDMLA
jgi:hypothetical protein